MSSILDKLFSSNSQTKPSNIPTKEIDSPRESTSTFSSENIKSEDRKEQENQRKTEAELVKSEYEIRFRFCAEELR
ncbi:hypothetical protein Daesc_001487 [Daldinia eschscholtzii]|uniref:Uncharacterized protein n=1 Tax=Daldinia eschscholtzii TaxID=292717 RepID=A0AAX6MUN5_9PEZI